LTRERDSPSTRAASSSGQQSTAAVSTAGLIGTGLSNSPAPPAVRPFPVSPRVQGGDPQPECRCALPPERERHLLVARTRLVKIAEQRDLCAVVNDFAIHVQDHRPQRELTVSRSGWPFAVLLSLRVG
jgi:hypothetical protein